MSALFFSSWGKRKGIYLFTHLSTHKYISREWSEWKNLSWDIILRAIKWNRLLPKPHTIPCTFLTMLLTFQPTATSVSIHMTKKKSLALLSSLFSLVFSFSSNQSNRIQSTKEQEHSNQTRGWMPGKAQLLLTLSASPFSLTSEKKMERESWEKRESVRANVYSFFVPFIYWCTWYALTCTDPYTFFSERLSCV